MKKYICLLALSLGLVACEKDDSAPKTAQESTGTQTTGAVESVVSDLVLPHNYSLKDGLEYGYELAISQDAAESGQAASSILMFRYSGNKDGKVQLFGDEGGVITTAECEGNCDFIKVMTFMGNQMLSKEMIKGGGISVASLALDDARNGKLEQYVHEEKGKKYHVWYTEKGRKLEEIK